MGCLFSLYMDLVPHLHDVKNDVASCHTKKKLAAWDTFQHETMEKAGLGEWMGNKKLPQPATGSGGLLPLLPGMGCTKSILDWDKVEETGSGIPSLVVRGYLLVVGFQKVLCEGTANQHRSPLYAFPFKQAKCGEQK